MKYFVDPNSGKPAYLQLYEQLRADIVDGIYQYGKKIPSKRLMAEETGVSVVTVEHSYVLLCDEGYLESRERSGYFVIFRADDSFPVAIPRKKQLREQTSVDHDFPFSILSKTMRRVLSEYGESILVKSPNRGCYELRAAISNYLARSRGVNAETEQIVIGSGAEYLYGIIVEMLGRDKIYGIEKPSYEKIELVYQASGVRYEMLPLGADGIESSALLNTAASVLHITPYRSFPSGVTASASKRREYIRWTNQGDRFIVEDDCESEFTVSKKPEETIFALSDKANIIYLNTFSQTIAPSIRVGYMVLPKMLVNLYEEKVGFYSCTVPAFEQYVLAELISSGDFERHINRVRRAKRKQLE